MTAWNSSKELLISGNIQENVLSVREQDRRWGSSLPGARSMGHGHSCLLFQFYKYSAINTSSWVFFDILQLITGRYLCIRPCNIGKSLKESQQTSLLVYVDKIYLANFLTFLFYYVTHTFIALSRDVQPSQWTTVRAQGGAGNGDWDVSVYPSSLGTNID